MNSMITFHLPPSCNNVYTIMVKIVFSRPKLWDEIKIKHRSKIKNQLRYKPQIVDHRSRKYRVKKIISEIQI